MDEGEKVEGEELLLSSSASSVSATGGRWLRGLMVSAAAGGGPEIRRWAALEAAGGLRLGAVAQWP